MYFNLLINDVFFTFVTSYEQKLRKRFAEKMSVTHGPWFTVVDPKTFLNSRVPSFTGNHGPIHVEADIEPFDIFETF